MAGCCSATAARKNAATALLVELPWASCHCLTAVVSGQQALLRHKQSALQHHKSPRMNSFSAGARLMFGGQPLSGHSIPKQYGAIQPTAVFVPLK